jgi:hypothetical protein
MDGGGIIGLGKFGAHGVSLYNPADAQTAIHSRNTAGRQS